MSAEKVVMTETPGYSVINLLIRTIPLGVLAIAIRIAGIGQLGSSPCSTSSRTIERFERTQGTDVARMICCGKGQQCWHLPLSSWTDGVQHLPMPAALGGRTGLLKVLKGIYLSVFLRIIEMHSRSQRRFASQRRLEEIQLNLAGCKT